MILEKQIQQLHHTEEYFFTAISQKIKHFGKESNRCASSYITGIEIESFNLLYLKEPNPLLEEYFQQGVDLLKNSKLPYSLQVRDCLIAQLEPTLLANGFTSDDSTLAMGLEIKKHIPCAHSKPDFWTIKATDHALEHWEAPLQTAFGMPNIIGQQYRQRHQIAVENNQQLKHFTLYIDALPVSSLTLSHHDAIARLDDIGTATLYQGKGYASALIQYALIYAEEMGVTHCYLEASKIGVPLYKSFGFIPLFEFIGFTQNLSLNAHS